MQDRGATSSREPIFADKFFATILACGVRCQLMIKLGYTLLYVSDVEATMNFCSSAFGLQMWLT